MGKVVFVRAFCKCLVLGIRYKKLVEDTEKEHITESDLFTASAPQETLTTSIVFLLWHYSPTDLRSSTKRVDHSPF